MPHRHHVRSGTPPSGWNASRFRTKNGQSRRTVRTFRRYSNQKCTRSGCKAAETRSAASGGRIRPHSSTPFDPGWQQGAMPLDPAAILACGDVHGDAGEVGYCLTVAEEQAAQAAFFLGDFGYWEHEPSGIAYLDEVEK